MYVGIFLNAHTIIYFEMKRKSNYIVRNFAGDNILVPLGSEVGIQKGMILLNNTGLYVWECLIKDCSLEELAISVANKFDISIDNAKKDVEIFISDIDNLGLIE